MTVAADRAAARKSGGVAARKSGAAGGGVSAGRPARAAAVEHLGRAERAARGKEARVVAPLDSHAEFSPGRGRDPVGLLLGQAASRVPELVPVRHGRMLVSPFTFYRGAALPMAADLAGTPSSGLRVQLCGDAHLSNFGAFASPERRLVFDVNDFDETLPGPFEWDVKRLAASLAVAGRANGFPAKAIEGFRTDRACRNEAQARDVVIMGLSTVRDHRGVPCLLCHHACWSLPGSNSARCWMSGAAASRRSSPRVIPGAATVAVSRTGWCSSMSSGPWCTGQGMSGSPRRAAQTAPSGGGCGSGRPGGSASCCTPPRCAHTTR